MWWLDAVLDAVAPVRCAGCGAAVAAVLCPVCSARLAEMGSPSLRLLQGVGVAAAFPYQWPVRELVLAGKHPGGQRSLRVLAAMAAERLADSVDADVVLVPVPLAVRRGRVRGFNQAAVLAAAIAAHLRLRVDASLVQRRRETGTQVAHDAVGRQQNVAGAFLARKEAAGLAVCVVDDVVTTGSTISAVAAALRAAAAAQVTAVAVAAAPDAALTPRGGTAIMGTPCLP